MNFHKLILSLAVVGVVSTANASQCNVEAGAEKALVSAIVQNNVSCANEAIQKGAAIDKAIAKYLIRNGTIQESQDGSYSENFAPIFLASYLGRTEIVKNMISKGVDLRATSEFQKETALAWAVSGKRADVAAALVAAGADVNQQMNKEYVAGSPFTALHIAAGNGHVPSAKVLVEAGADIEAVRGDYGDTPLFSALEHYKEDNKADMVKYLVSVGADVNFLPRNGGKVSVNSLWYAAANGDVEIGSLLIQKGADVNYQHPEISIWGVLNVAAGDGHIDFVKLLIANKANLNQKTADDGFTVMHEAALNGNAEMVKLLAKGGAYLNELVKNYQDRDGKNLGDVTPLDLAISKGNTQAAQTLRKLGAKKASELKK